MRIGLLLYTYCTHVDDVYLVSTGILFCVVGKQATQGLSPTRSVCYSWRANLLLHGRLQAGPTYVPLLSVFLESWKGNKTNLATGEGGGG